MATMAVEYWIFSRTGLHSACMKKSIFYIVALVLALVLAAQTSQAQQRRRQQTRAPSGSYLPRAGFPVYGTSQGGGFAGGYSAGYTGSAPAQAAGTPVQAAGSPAPAAGGYGSPYGGSSDLPVVSGLHLQEGLDRREGSGTQPYDPGEEKLGGAWVRWDTKRMPLRVWISEGKQLPSVPWEVIIEDRVPRISTMLRANPAAFNELPVAAGWTPQMNDAAASGFEEWREQGSALQFGFVDDPHRADILVFFTDHFAGADGPGGTTVHGQTYGQLFTIQQYEQKLQLRQPNVPVVIELSVNEELNKLQADAAHEFGHALGIKAHSPYRQDLMYVNRIVESPSPADRATLHMLYSKTPKYWYY